MKNRRQQGSMLYIEGSVADRSQLRPGESANFQVQIDRGAKIAQAKIAQAKIAQAKIAQAKIAQAKIAQGEFLGRTPTLTLA